MKVLIVTLCTLACLRPSPLAAQAPADAVSAQTPPADNLSLQELLETQVVSTASKFRQEVREAPASITVVTSEDIRRHGHRTLAEVLKSVRGFYVTNDRNYSYVGVRGFARPGDYNTRVLLLLDGHRINDAVYDMAPIGTDFPVDVSLIERVEIIRGPGSSLYGTSAFFAVINVVTHTGAEHSGIRVDANAGSLATTGATVSFGRLFAGNRELLIAGSAYRSAGADRLHFPEFGAIGSGATEAIGLDHDESFSTFSSLAAGPLALRAGIGSRRKQIPTASFETVFGDDRFYTRDTHGYVNLTYDGVIGRGWSGTAKAAYDYYGYEGIYPYDYGETAPVLWLDGAQAQTVGGELTASRRLAAAHLLTVGAEVRYQFRSRMTASDYTGTLLHIDQPGTIVGLYVQDEVRVRPWLVVNAGARIDRYPTFGSYMTPRVGVVLLPRRATAIKLLHGRAFRAPNPYEIYYFSAAPEGFALAPEKIHSTELVWEEAVSSRVRTAISAFRYRASDIIELGTDATASDGAEPLFFANAGNVEGLGVEGEIEARLPYGVSARFNHSAVRTRHTATHRPVSNSPRHVSKLGLQVPIASLMLGIEGQFVGERLTNAGQALPGFFVPNVTLTSPLTPRLDISVGVYNAFDTRYSDPGAEEHRQRFIPQDGRTFLARVRVGF